MIIFGLKIILTNFELFLVISNSMPEDKHNGFRNNFNAVLNAFIVLGNQSCYLLYSCAVELRNILRQQNTVSLLVFDSYSPQKVGRNTLLSRHSRIALHFSSFTMISV